MRYTRQELKQDKFAATAADAVHWTVEHRSKLVNAAVALVVAILVVAGAWWYGQHREAQAADALGKAIAIYQSPLRAPGQPADPQQVSFTSVQERSIAAKTEFHSVAAEYGSTKSGKYAKYFAGLCEMEAGNGKIGEEQLKYVTALRDSDLASLGKMALAAGYRDDGRVSDAANIYKELVEHPTRSVSKAAAQMQLADLLAAKQPADAKKIYDQIAKENPNSVAGELATQKAGDLKQ